MEELIESCKGGIYLRINEHRDVYQTTEDAIKEINSISDAPAISEELAKEMIVKDTIIMLQFYPHTPIGFYVVYGTSYEEVVREAMEILEDNK